MDKVNRQKEQDWKDEVNTMGDTKKKPVRPEGICIRTGHHCAQPLHIYLGINASCRASFYFYNTEEEVDYFLEKLKDVRKVMGYDD